MRLTKKELIGWIENEIALSLDEDDEVNTIEIERACWTVIDNFRETHDDVIIDVDDAFFEECLVELNKIWSEYEYNDNDCK